VHGESDVFDLSKGAQVTIEDQNGVIFSADYKNCRMNRRRRHNFRCMDESRSSVVYFRKLRSENSVRFGIFGRSHATPGETKGPLTMRISTGNLQRGGGVPGCIVKRGHLICEKLAPWRIRAGRTSSR
jgi:hypothetical protein